MIADVETLADWARHHAWKRDHTGLSTEFNFRTAEDGDWCTDEECPRCLLLMVAVRLDSMELRSPVAMFSDREGE